MTIKWFTVSGIAAGALMLVGAASDAHAQAAVISGRVTNTEGQPLSGANVQIVALNLTVAANAEGQYTLTVPAVRVTSQEVAVRARAIGYSPQTRAITLRAGTQTVDFSLRQDVNQLSEVIVTGVSGATEQSKVPFKVERLTAEQMPVSQPDPLRMIQGKVPGARISQASGRPGQAPAIILRGPTSINASGRGQGPLVIVDGTVLASGLDDINSEDIESIEIVKGAAASSLYGASAGRGVLQITTKSGRTSTEGLRFHVRQEFGRSQINGDIRIAQNHSLLLDETGQLFCVGGVNVRDCNRRINWLNEALRINDIPVGETLPFSPATFPVDPGSNTPFAQQHHVFQAETWMGPTYNPVDQFTTNAPSSVSQLDMTGKFGGTGIFASINRTVEGGGLIYMDGSRRASGRLNIDQQIGDKWNASLRTYYARSLEDGLQFESGGNFSGGTATSPFFRLTRQARIVDLSRRDSRGRLFARSMLTNGGAQNQNPLMFLEQIVRDDVTNRFLGGVTLRYTPFTWLDLNGNYSYDASDSRGREQVDKGFVTTGFQANNSLGYYTDNADNWRAYNTSFDATATKSFGDLNTRTALRYLFEQQDQTGNYLFGRGFAVAGVFDALNVVDQANKSIDTYAQSIRGMGFFVNEAIDWKDRYILDLLWRRDGSSLFGPDHRWQTFGRASVAWRVSQEPWWFVRAIDDLKFRASRGTAGSKPNFAAQYETYTIAASGVSPATQGNRILRPEVTTEDEIGVDAQFFGRYGLSLTYADADTRDQILLVPAPAATGFANQWQNAGEVNTRTFEASLNIPLINRQNLNWSTRFVYDKGRSRITKLVPPPFNMGTQLQGTEQMFLIKEGDNIGTFYGRKFARSCSDLPAAWQGDCGGPTSAFQTNDEGWLVWVGAGNTWQDGITKNLWGTALMCNPMNSPTGPVPGSAACAAVTPFAQNLYWGRPIVLRDSVGTAQVHALGNALPDFQWGWSNTMSWRRLNAYVQFDAKHGNDVFNIARHWSLLDFTNADQDQIGKSVATAKPLGYYFRSGAPDRTDGSGGFYDVLGPTNNTVEDASFIKLREVAVGYDFGRIAGVRGNWRVNLVGRNLKTWSSYRGWDPEVGTFATSLNQQNSGTAVLNAVDSFGFPPVRTFSLSISSTF